MTAPSVARTWRDEAACARFDPEDFDPKNSHVARQAQAVCATCPVRRECLIEALAEEATTQFGPWLIRGGLTPKTRRDLTPRQRTDLIRDLTNDLKENPS